MPEVTEQTHAAKAVKTGIKPLLETEWSQEAPFNQLCSYSNGTSISPAVTGCVATAMSQIMYFHKWPEKSTGSYSYDYSIDVNGKEVQVGFDPRESLLDTLRNRLGLTTHTIMRPCCPHTVPATHNSKPMQWLF